MRFKPGTTQAQMQATMEALANRPKTRGAAGIDGTRLYGGSMNLGTAAGPGGGRPGMGVPPSSQVNPQQPNVMGFPDRTLAPGATPPPQFGQMTPQQASAFAGRPSSQAAYNQYMQQATGGQSGMMPVSPVVRRGNSPGNFPTRPQLGFANRPPGAPPLPGNKVAPPPTPPGISVGVPGTDTYKFTPMSPGMPTTTTNIGRPANPFTVDAMPIGSAPAFKKGGMVKPKAPVKKVAGGKVAAKAPVKKAMGGPIKAKPAAKPAAKMAKPMPAMKRGGKVMAKGRKK